MLTITYETRQETREHLSEQVRNQLNLDSNNSHSGFQGKLSTLSLPLRVKTLYGRPIRFN